MERIVGMSEKRTLNDLVLAEIKNSGSQSKQIVNIDHGDRKETLSVTEFVHRTSIGTLPVIISSYPKYLYPNNPR